jgi:hypothetical protein
MSSIFWAPASPRRIRSLLATALEAYLIRGEVEVARGLVGEVVAASGNDHAALSATGRQLERIVQAKRLDSTILAAFVPPAIVHFVGHMIAPPGASGRFQAVQEAKIATDIAGVLEGMEIGAAYGSLASGADILFAEALLGREVALNVVLPFSVADFIEQSVRPAGESWIPRFEACLAAAKTVRFATEDSYLGDDQLFTYCSWLAMGLASLRARHLHAPLMQLAVWDGVTPPGAIAGTAADMGAWAFRRRLSRAASGTRTHCPRRPVSSFSPAAATRGPCCSATSTVSAS